MTFRTILDRTNRPDEKMYLLARSNLLDSNNKVIKNELGFAKEGLEDVMEIHGVIQRSQLLDINTKGEESNPLYIGYFLPEFNINTERLSDYKIRYERPYETKILKIIEYNPNLFLRHTRDHIQLTLILEKKDG